LESIIPTPSLLSIENVTTIDVNLKDQSQEAIDKLISTINNGLDNRKTRDTYENEVSSRSHLVFNVYLTKRWEGEDVLYKYTFIDLAGKERVAKIDISPKYYLEAIFINEGLETL
jgi:3-hydroxyacyl-CoA dehydrogenase